jgi:hypothetical protein
MRSWEDAKESLKISPDTDYMIEGFETGYLSKYSIMY